MPPVRACHGMATFLSLQDEAALRAFLSEDPTANLYLLGALEEHGVTGRHGGPPASFLVERNEAGGIEAIAFVLAEGRLVVPAARHPTAAHAIGRAMRHRFRILGMVGERRAVDALWGGYGSDPTRLFRAQRLYRISADDMGPFVTRELRAATQAELDQVVEAAGRMHEEDLGVDPRTFDPEGFRRRCADRITRGRTFVLLQEGRLAFKADVGTRCAGGAQIEGVYTAPEFRRRGLATLAMGQLCRTLLSGLPRVTLHVDEANHAAITLYKKVGFVSSSPFRLVAVE